MSVGIAERLVQPELDLHASVRATDPDTSRDAAIHAMPRAGTHRLVALEALAAAGPRGMTDFELEAATGVRQTSIGKRRKELVDMGLVEPMVDEVTGRQRRRLAPSGAPAGVYVVSSAGVGVLAAARAAGAVVGVQS